VVAALSDRPTNAQTQTKTSEADGLAHHQHGQNYQNRLHDAAIVDHQKTAYYGQRRLDEDDDDDDALSRIS
jgi:hypothetical protein